VIDKIVELILKEARTVKNPDPVSQIYAVIMEAHRKLFDIMINLRNEERRQKSHE